MTDRSYDLRAIVRVMDRASAPLRRIAGSFRRLAAMARLSQMAQAFRGVTDAVGNLTSGLRRFLSLGATLGAGATVAGIMQIASGFAMAGDSIAKTADRLGVGVEALQEWRHAADLSGVQASAFDNSMQRLNRALADAAAGRNREVAELFDRLGISLHDATGELRTATDVLPEVADGFAANTNASVGTRMAFALFGREGVSLVNMLANGSERLGEMREEARALGLVIGEDAARESEGYIDTLARFRGATMGLRNAIGSQLIPIFEPLIAGLTSWIAANRDVIAERVAEFVDRVATAIGNVDWQAVGGWFSDIASAASRVADALGGWDNAALLLVGVFNADLIRNVAGLASALFRFGLVLWANPIVLAAAAIAGAAYLIWENWDSIVGFFQGLWDDIGKIFEAAWEWISDIVDSIIGGVGRVLSAIGTMSLSISGNNDDPRMLVTRDGSADVPVAALPAGGAREHILELVEAGEHPVFESVFTPDEAPAAPADLAAPDVLGEAIRSGVVGPGAQADARDANGHLIVDFQNVPDGVRIREADDSDADMEVNVGYGHSLAGHAGTAY